MVTVRGQRTTTAGRRRLWLSATPVPRGTSRAPTPSGPPPRRLGPPASATFELPSAVGPGPWRHLAHASPLPSLPSLDFPPPLRSLGPARLPSPREHLQTPRDSLAPFGRSPAPGPWTDPSRPSPRRRRAAPAAARTPTRAAEGRGAAGPGRPRLHGAPGAPEPAALGLLRGPGRAQGSGRWGGLRAARERGGVHVARTAGAAAGGSRGEGVEAAESGVWCRRRRDGCRRNRLGRLVALEAPLSRRCDPHRRVCASAGLARPSPRPLRETLRPLLTALTPRLRLLGPRGRLRGHPAEARPCAGWGPGPRPAPLWASVSPSGRERMACFDVRRRCC